MTFDKIDNMDPTPKYLQAERILLNAIREGTLSPGSKLPSTMEIGRQIDISLITAQKALERMVDSGWLRRERGRGTFVREDVFASGPNPSTLMVGIVLDPNVNINDFYHSTLLNGLRREGQKLGQAVEFFFPDGIPTSKGKNYRRSGMICVHPPVEKRLEVEQLAENWPTVVLGGAFPDTQLPTVDCDNFSGSMDAIRYLVSLNHKQFLVVSGQLSLTNSRDRVEGALQEFRKQGVAETDYQVFESIDSFQIDDETRKSIEKALHGPNRPTAILAGGYYLAMAILQIVRSQGLNVPQDVSIVGFDDPASASLLHPPLTTVRQPLETMAEESLKLLYEGISTGKFTSHGLTLPAELVIRESTCPRQG